MLYAVSAARLTFAGYSRRRQWWAGKLWRRPLVDLILFCVYTLYVYIYMYMAIVSRELNSIVSYRSSPRTRAIWCCKTFGFNTPQCRDSTIHYYRRQIICVFLRVSFNCPGTTTGVVRLELWKVRAGYLYYIIAWTTLRNWGAIRSLLFYSLYYSAGQI